MNEGKRHFCYSALLCWVVFASLSFGAIPAFAGFEWTPPRQNTPDVPVVAPQRDVVVPQEYKSTQPVAAPSVSGLGTDPNKKLHVMRRDESSGMRAQNVSRSGSMRMIEKNPASDSGFAPLPPLAPPPVTLSIPAPAPDVVSHSYDSPAFMPLPDEHAVYSDTPNQYSQRRKTTGTAPVPLVVENMQDMPRANVPSSYQRREAPRGWSLFGGKDNKKEQVPSPSPVFPGGTGIVINPYPQKTIMTAVPTSPSFAPPVLPSMNASLPVLSNYDVVPGFGNDIPMIMALQQIVPASYTYSFSPGVNPGQRVSWEGGRPWNVILADMVAPLGLQANIHAQSVSIR